MESIWQLSSDGFSRADRFDAWCSAVSGFNDVLVPLDLRHHFQATTSYWQIGSLLLVNSTASRLRLVRGAAMAVRDQLDHDVVVVFASGESVTEVRGQVYQLCAGEVAFASRRDGYDFQVTSDTATWHELIVPSDLRDKLVESGDGKPRRDTPQTPQVRLLGQFIRAVADGLPDLAANDMPLIEQALLSLYSAARRTESHGPARLSATDRQTVDRARVAALIERHLSSARLTVNRISAQTGVSRSALFRLFEADNGVANFIRHRRLDTLRDDLVDPRNQHKSIAVLSEARGFHSPSTLNRAFRQRFGCTPTEVRDVSGLPSGNVSGTRIEGVIDYLRARRR
jgi:AraC-like DNA-binding protein